MLSLWSHFLHIKLNLSVSCGKYCMLFAIDFKGSCNSRVALIQLMSGALVFIINDSGYERKIFLNSVTHVSKECIFIWSFLIKLEVAENM